MTHTTLQFKTILFSLLASVAMPLTSIGYAQTAPYDPTKPAPSNVATPVDEKTTEEKPKVEPTIKESVTDNKKDDAAGKGQPLMLWEVKSATNTVYLYGTVHAGKSSFFPLPDRVEKAFGDAKVLAVEADISNLSVLRDVAPLMAYTPPDTLETKLPKALFERFKKLCQRYKIPIAEAQKFRPFMASSLVALGEITEAGYEVRYGIDGYFIDQAKLVGKSVKELEGVGAQIKLFSEFTDAESLTWFTNAVTALESDKSRTQLEALMGAWRAGDTAKLAAALKDYNVGLKDADKFDERLIYGRHEAMAIKIGGYLNQKNEPHFVAVGSLHLVGPKGLVEMMKARGFKVTQLSS